MPTCPITSTNDFSLFFWTAELPYLKRLPPCAQLRRRDRGVSDTPLPAISCSLHRQEARFFFSTAAFLGGLNQTPTELAIKCAANGKGVIVLANVSNLAGISEAKLSDEIHIAAATSG